jgi:hypothetical protein
VDGRGLAVIVSGFRGILANKQGKAGQGFLVGMISRDDRERHNSGGLIIVEFSAGSSTILRYVPSSDSNCHLAPRPSIPLTLHLMEAVLLLVDSL